MTETQCTAFLQLPSHCSSVQVPNTGATKRRATTRPVNGDKFEGSSSANVILYVGLGMVCIGLIITFVGIGDKGFQTLELKLIGPSLVGCGVFFALLREAQS